MAGDLMQFRPMQMADVDVVMEIEPTIYPYPWSRGNFTDSIKSGYQCWVGELNGRIMAYFVVMMVLDEAHLLNISITKAYQGKGYGRALLDFAMRLGRDLGGLNMFLEVRISNKNAVHLYESAGFNEMAIRRGYYPAHNGREDAILMGMSI